MVRLLVKASPDDTDAYSGGELPYTPALVTSDHPISRNWSTENLPEILFYLHPPTSQHEDQDVKYLMDEETGEIARSDENNEIKDFEILPRYISLEVEGWSISIPFKMSKLTLDRLDG